jgi:DNA mismatch repair protein MSH5
VFQHFEGYHLAMIGRRISETIDLTASAEQGRTAIMTGSQSQDTFILNLTA